MSSTVPMLTFPWMFTLVPSTCLARYAVVEPGAVLGWAPGRAGWAGGGVWATAADTPINRAAADPRRTAIRAMSKLS